MKKAFTLIELLVVIAIIGVLGRAFIARSATGTRGRTKAQLPEQVQTGRHLRMPIRHLPITMSLLPG